MGIDLISGVFAAAAAHWVINGLPVEATYLKSASPGCIAASARASDWRKAGRKVTEQRVGHWCVVGTVIDRYWVSEQWQAYSTGGFGAYGWRVRLPLGRQRQTPQLPRQSFPIDLVDPAISARIQFRSSLDSLDIHHQKTLHSIAADTQTSQVESTSSATQNHLRISRLRNGALVVSGSSAGSRYSVVVQRGVIR